MNLDEMMAVWQSQESPLYGVDKTLLHQLLQQEHANIEKVSHWGTRVGYAGGTVLFIATGLFLTMMTFQSNYRDVLIMWDYMVGGIGVGAAITVAWTTFAYRRSWQARERRFGASLRDHVRRRFAQIDDEATDERRLGVIALGAGLICAVAISIVQKRITHVPVPCSEMDWPAPFWTVLILALLSLELFRWGPRRARRKILPRKRHLEALLRELDGELSAPVSDQAAARFSRLPVTL